MNTQLFLLRLLAVITAPFAAMIAAADEPPPAPALTLSGVVRDTDLQPLAHLTIDFYRKLDAEGETWERRSVETAADGSWSIALPAGEWLGAPHPHRLLARGYFCVPGFPICIVPEPANTLSWTSCEVTSLPPVWQNPGGEIIWMPPRDPTNIELIAVPTRPSLEVSKPLSEPAAIKVAFETITDPAIEPQLVRQWRVEGSTDGRTWTALAVVALTGSSPIFLTDPDATSAPAVLYRAAQVADLVLEPDNP